jgi:TonB family protein
LTVYKIIRDNRRVVEFLPWLNKQMSRLFLLTIAVTGTIFAAPILVRAGVQQKRAEYGPVVRAYLTNLVEELNELDYQLSRREITGADYQRSKQRLTFLRRYVERHAARSREDAVPEIQVLTEDEFGTIGLRPNPFELKTGDVLDGQWKLIGVERARARFFVLERIEHSEKSLVENTRSKQKSARRENPLDLIETIVIRDSNVQTSSPQTVSQQVKPPVDSPSPPAAPKSPLPPAPRITYIYLPQYTDKARAKAVEGELIVRAIFQRDGRITNVKVERGLGFGLDQRAIDSVKRIGFVPATTEGKEVDVSTLVIFNFRLSKVTFHVQPEPHASKDEGQGTRP